MCIRDRVITIDDFMAARPTIDAALIKTDLEGHDLEALRGMRATVERCRPLILTECNNSAALLNLCIEWRYSIFAYRRDRRTLKLNFQQLSSAEELQESWYKMLFPVSYTHLEEAHFLTLIYAAHSILPGGLNPYLKRIWTGIRTRNVVQDDANLTIWHLPWEKRFGKMCIRDSGRTGT